MSNVNDRDEARRTADRVVRRERRRIRSLAVLAVGLWVLAALLIASVYLPMGAKLKQFAKILAADAPAGFHFDPQRIDTTTPPTPAAAELPAVVAQMRHQQWIMGQIVFHEWIVGAIILAFALATGVLASVATVVLALTIRRVTLRQVGEQLAQISDQLRQIQGPSA